MYLFNLADYSEAYELYPVWIIFYFIALEFLKGACNALSLVSLSQCYTNNHSKFPVKKKS